MDKKKMLSLVLPDVVADELKRQADSHGLTTTGYIRALVAYARGVHFDYDQLNQMLVIVPKS